MSRVFRERYARGRSAYWDRYGLLVGSVAVAAGAVGWTRPGQPAARRAVGGVVLAGQLLLAFQTVTPVGCAARPPATAPPAG